MAKSALALAVLALAAAHIANAQSFRAGEWRGYLGKNRDGRFEACNIYRADDGRDLVPNGIDIAGFADGHFEFTLTLDKYEPREMREDEFRKLSWKRERGSDLSLGRYTWLNDLGPYIDARARIGLSAGEGKQIAEGTYPSKLHARDAHESSLSSVFVKPGEKYRRFFRTIRFEIKDKDCLLTKLGEAISLDVSVDGPIPGARKFKLKDVLTLPFTPKRNDASRALARLRRCLNEQLGRKSSDELETDSEVCEKTE